MRTQKTGNDDRELGWRDINGHHKTHTAWRNDISIANIVLPAPLPSCRRGLPEELQLNQCVCLTLAFLTIWCWRSPREWEILQGCQEILSSCGFIHEGDHSGICLHHYAWAKTTKAALKQRSEQWKLILMKPEETLRWWNTSWCVPITWHYYSPWLRWSFSFHFIWNECPQINVHMDSVFMQRFYASFKNTEGGLNQQKEKRRSLSQLVVMVQRTMLQLCGQTDPKKDGRCVSCSPQHARIS